MIDHLYKKNVNAEGAILDTNSISQILGLLENGSLVESVRVNLSEKRKMKEMNKSLRLENSQILFFSQYFEF